MERRAFGDAGIGDHNLLWPDFGEQGFRRTLVCHIQNMAFDQGVGAGQRFQRFTPAPADMDRRPAGGEICRQHPAKAAAAAGHKDTSLRKLHAICLLPL